MHDNIFAAIAALKVLISVSSSIGSNVSQLVTMLSLAVIQLVSGKIVN